MILTYFFQFRLPMGSVNSCNVCLFAPIIALSLVVCVIEDYIIIIIIREREREREEESLIGLLLLLILLVLFLVKTISRTNKQSSSHWTIIWLIHTSQTFIHSLDSCI